jgi:hypothetical protein
MPKGKEYQYFDFPVTDARSRQGGGMSPKKEMGHGGKIKYQEGSSIKDINKKSKAAQDKAVGKLVESPIKGKKGLKTKKKLKNSPKKVGIKQKAKNLLSKFKPKKATKSATNKKKNVFSAKKSEARYNKMAKKVDKVGPGVKKKKAPVKTKKKEPSAAAMFKAKPTKKDSGSMSNFGARVQGQKRVQANKDKAKKTGQSWKKASAAAKKSGTTMNKLIAQRKGLKKGSPEYKKVQAKINKMYGK